MKIDRARQDKIWHLLLRWIPVLPMPEIYDLLRDVKRSQNTVDRQVSEAIEAIQKTSTLVTELEEGLKDRAAKLEHLQKEHERYSQLANIEAEKAGALLTQIEATLGKNVQRERWIAFGINIAAGLIIFLLGVVLSDPIKQLWTTLMK
jgi:predicted RNase H-like nuclease (RuvC/YqgF family)